MAVGMVAEERIPAIIRAVKSIHNSVDRAKSKWERALPSTPIIRMGFLP